MKIIAWNCRGLGLDPTVGELRELIRSYNPEVVFLSEIKKGWCDGGTKMEFGL